MMLQSSLWVLALAFAPLISDAALFPKTSNVQQIDHKGFRDALKEDITILTAFVAPWCGYCQKLAPELVKVADGLKPLIPVYAVDCDDVKNKALCAEQGIKGFPTIKLFPRGTKFPPLEFDGTRSASSIFYWASRAVPNTIQRTTTTKGLSDLVSKNAGKPKAVLLNKTNKTPLLWRVLSNKYVNKITFINCRDRRGMVSTDLGYEVGEKSKGTIIVYDRDGNTPVRYEGIVKFEALSKFFDEILDGTIDISRADVHANQEAFNIPGAERIEDETRIGDAGYMGFNAHEGLDSEELLKRGSGHPGAPSLHGSFHSQDDEPTASFAALTKEGSPVTESLSAETEASREYAGGNDVKDEL